MKIWTRFNSDGFSVVLMQNIDERGTPNSPGSLDRTVQPRQNQFTGWIFLIWGIFWSRIQRRGSFPSMRVFSYGPELNFHSEMIYILYTPTNKRNDDKLTTNTNVKRSWHRSGPVSVRYIRAWNGYPWVVRDWENFIKIFCNQGEK